MIGSNKFQSHLTSTDSNRFHLILSHSMQSNTILYYILRPDLNSIQLYPIWSHSFWFVPILSITISFETYDPIWTPLIWSHLTSSAPICSNLSSNDLVWSHLIKSYQNWSHPISFNIIWSHSISSDINLSHLIQSDPVGSVLIRFYLI